MEFTIFRFASLVGIGCPALPAPKVHNIRKRATGGKIDAASALKLGLVPHVCDGEESGGAAPRHTSHPNRAQARVQGGARRA